MQFLFEVKHKRNKMLLTFNGYNIVNLNKYLIIYK